MWNKKIEVLVGVFVVLGFLSFVYLALKVSGLSFSEQAGSYRLYAYFANVSGLNTRSKVNMAGVTIGRVEDIKLDRDEQSALVILRINNNVDFLTKDASLRILTAGLLGEKYLGFENGFEEEVLKDGDYVEETQSSLVLENLIGKFLLKN